MVGKNATESGAHEALDLFLKIGLDERTAKNTVANNKVTANLTAVIHEVCIFGGTCDYFVWSVNPSVAFCMCMSVLLYLVEVYAFCLGFL